MAICIMKFGFLGNGTVRSPAAAVAYASGEKVTDPRTGQEWEFTSASALRRINGAPKVMLPDDAVMHEQEFVNMAHLPEKRKDARVVETGIVMMPIELTPGQNEAGAREMLFENFVKHGYAVHYTMHNLTRDEKTGKEANPHFHFYATLRKYNPAERNLVGKKVQLNIHQLRDQTNERRKSINDISARILIENGFAPAAPPHSHVNIPALEIALEESQAETAALEIELVLALAADAAPVRNDVADAYADTAPAPAVVEAELPQHEIAADETSIYILNLRRTNAVPAKKHREHAADQSCATAELLRTDLYCAEIVKPGEMTADDIRGLKRRAADVAAVVARGRGDDERGAKIEARQMVATGQGLSFIDKALRFLREMEYEEARRRANEHGHGG